MNLRYKLGLINEQGDSIRRLKKLVKTCERIECSNKFNYKPETYNQCIQPEVCFLCDHYHKATKTTPADYGWSKLL